MSERPVADGESQNGSGEIDPSELDAEELARQMSAATDEQLVKLMSGPMRERILAEIFRRMKAHFRADAAADTEAVIHWRIGDRPGGGHDEFESVIADGTCEVHAGLRSHQPRVTLTIGGADFLRLVTGSAAGPMLFMTGRLKIEGDMMFAASAASLFAIPRA